MYLRPEDPHSVEESLFRYIAVTPTVTNAQMREWLQKYHGIKANSVQADDIIYNVRQRYAEQVRPARLAK